MSRSATAQRTTVPTALGKFRFDPSRPPAVPTGGLNRTIVRGGLCHVSSIGTPTVWLDSVNHGRFEQALPSYACWVTILADPTTRDVSFQFS